MPARPAGRAIPRRSAPCSTACWPASGAPPAAALTALFERWNELAGCPLADHAVPGSLEAGVLVVEVDDPLWATEWRYRQGEVLRRCDEVLGAGVVGPDRRPGEALRAPPETPSAMASSATPSG